MTKQKNTNLEILFFNVSNKIFYIFGNIIDFHKNFNFHTQRIVNFRVNQGMKIYLYDKDFKTLYYASNSLNQIMSELRIHYNTYKKCITKGDLYLNFFNISNKIHKEQVNYKNYIAQSFHHKSFKEKDYTYKNKLLQFIEICKLIFNYVDEKNNENSRRSRIIYKNTFYCSMDVIVQDDGIVVQPNSICVEFLQELLNKVEKRIEILRSKTNTLQNGNK